MLWSLATPYDTSYFTLIQKYSECSAAAVVPLLLALVKPASVVDVGCGTGTWLKHFQRLGVKETLGMDGEWVGRSALQIPEEGFEVTDLARPLRPDRRFDLVVSLEVAEHLPAESADELVDLLTDLGPAIAFSAAIPHQGGTGHVNEQWPGYWAKRFVGRGYVPFDVIRPRIWNDERIAWWYRQNLVLYVDRERLNEYPTLDCPDREVLPLVHPELFSYRAQAAENAAEQPPAEPAPPTARQRLRPQDHLRTRLRGLRARVRLRTRLRALRLRLQRLRS